ncbi:hypothetical protein G6F68_019459 [Rhizopus microsporus]|nr:hypothetical protein G6F68_019459 [Rhizopus microsporus]
MAAVLPQAWPADRGGQQRLRRRPAQARAAAADHRLRAEEHPWQHRLPGLAGAAAGAQPSHRGAGGGRFALRARLCRRPAAHVRP